MLAPAGTATESSPWALSVTATVSGLAWAGMAGTTSWSARPGAAIGAPAESAPKRTSVAPLSPAPMMTIESPPASDPLGGRMPVMAGWYVKLDGAAAVAPGGVDTPTAAAPAWLTGVVATTDVPSGDAVTPMAAAEPNFTVEPCRSVPVRCTTVPPVAGPVATSMALTTGAR